MLISREGRGPSRGRTKCAGCAGDVRGRDQSRFPCWSRRGHDCGLAGGITSPAVRGLVRLPAGAAVDTGQFPPSTVIGGQRVLCRLKAPKSTYRPRCRIGLGGWVGKSSGVWCPVAVKYLRGARRVDEERRRSIEATVAPKAVGLLDTVLPRRPRTRAGDTASYCAGGIAGGVGLTWSAGFDRAAVAASHLGRRVAATKEEHCRLGPRQTKGFGSSKGFNCLLRTLRGGSQTGNT